MSNRAGSAVLNEYSDFLTALTSPPWRDCQPTSGSIGTRATSPGAKEYVIEFTYVAFVDTSERSGNSRTAACGLCRCVGPRDPAARQR